MLGALSFPSGASLAFPAGSRRSDWKMPSTVRVPGRSTISASGAAAAPPVESGRKPALNLYEVLRVKRNASQTEIKAAYRALAKVYHPDVAGGCGAARHPEEETFGGCDFIEIHNAYSTLSDPAARAVYDLRISVESQRRSRSAAGINSPVTAGFRRHSGFYTTRRWETDQCW